MNRTTAAPSYPSTSWDTPQKASSPTVGEPIVADESIVRPPGELLARIRAGRVANDTDIDEYSPRSTRPFESPTSIRTPATLLAEWNGSVSSIEQYCFTATLKGVYGEGIQGEYEEAEIPISDVSESDMELLRPGHFFRLCVFYEVSEDGQPSRSTQVVFRRLPAYRQHDLDRAAERGDELHRGLRVG